MNLPNAITVARLILTAAFVAFVSADGLITYFIATVVFIIAAISDFLDGWLARKMGLVTSMGKLLDPLADKILVSAAFLFLTAQDLCPLWITALIISREFLVTGLRQIAVEAGEVLAADRLGKWKTGAQLSYLISGLVWLTAEKASEPLPAIFAFLQKLAVPFFADGGLIMPASLIAAVVLTVVSGWNYVWSSRHMLKSR